MIMGPTKDVLIPVEEYRALQAASCITKDKDLITIHRSEYERLLDQDRFLSCIYSTNFKDSVDFQIALNRWLSSKDENYVA